MVVTHNPTPDQLAFVANDQKTASVVWGATLGIGFLTGWKAIEQSHAISRRTGCARNLYIWMVWILWIDNFIGGVIIWLFINGKIPPSIPYFFTLVTIWAIEVQLLPQIIVNRIGLILDDRDRLRMYKYGTATLVTIVCIVVYTIWIPARMEVSERYMKINSIWDRTEKVIFLVLDAFLNGTFMYLVRSRLVSQGLTKYNALFRFNACIVSLSLSMDVLLIGMMSLPNTFSYAQFHPLAYLVKLYIEMSMSDFIVRVAKSPSRIDSDGNVVGSYDSNTTCQCFSEDHTVVDRRHFSHLQDQGDLAAESETVMWANQEQQIAKELDEAVQRGYSVGKDISRVLSVPCDGDIEKI